MIVVDASALVRALAQDTADAQLVRERLAGEEIAAPDLIDLEVTSALRGLRYRESIPEQRAQLALSDLAALPIARARHLSLLPRCWELRDNLTVYDAAYVALAELLGAPVLTADARLARAPGLRCRVELLC